jgi:hypothetical protein
MYELKETPIMEQPVVDTSKFVTRGEFDEVISRLKNYLNSFSIEKTEPAAANAPAPTKPEKSERSFDF